MSFSYQSTVPIHMLPGLGSRTAKALRKLGIRTVGDFKKTPERVLVELFGPSIKSLHRYVSQDSYAVIRKKQMQQRVRPAQKTIKKRSRTSQYAKVALLSALALTIS